MIKENCVELVLKLCGLGGEVLEEIVGVVADACPGGSNGSGIKQDFHDSTREYS